MAHDDAEIAVATATNGMPAVITAEPVFTDANDPETTGVSFVADINQVVDVSAHGVILQIGEVRIPLEQLLHAFTRERERTANLPLPEFDPVAVAQANNGILPGPDGEVYQGPLPPIPISDKDIYGYDRAMSDWALPEFGQDIVIPVINPDLALPPIITNPVAREFNDTRQGARLLASTGNDNYKQQILLTEFPPAIYHVYAGGRGDATPYLIPTPYIVALAYPFANSLCLFASAEPVTRMDQKLIALPFPHVDQGGRVCVGTNPPRRAKWPDMRPLEVMADFMTHYWHTAFKYFLTEYPKFNQSLSQATKLFGGIRKYDRYDVQSFMKALEKLSLDEVLKLDYTGDHTTSVADQFSDYARRYAPHQTPTWMITPEQMAAVDTATFYTEAEIAAMNDTYLNALGVRK